MPAKWKHQMRSFQRIDRSPGRGGEIVGWNMAATREDAGKRHRGKRSALILKREGGKTGVRIREWGVCGKEGKWAGGGEGGVGGEQRANIKVGELDYCEGVGGVGLSLKKGGKWT